jgi:hypothetical protein
MSNQQSSQLSPAQQPGDVPGELWPHLFRPNRPHPARADGNQVPRGHNRDQVQACASESEGFSRQVI